MPKNIRTELDRIIPPVDLIIRYEQGGLDREEVIELFQSMIDSGLVWQLQGHYGRTAMELIKAGVCHR